MALYIGLHRDPNHLPKMSVLAAEIRRRLWATILEILVQSSMDSGGPPFISPNDYDTKPPGNFDDEDLLGDDVSTQTPSPRPITTFTDTSVQLALLDSIKIRLQIASYLNEFRSVPGYDRTLALNSDLTSASRGLDALLRVYQSQEPGLSAFQLCISEHIIQRYFLALHLPWLTFAKDDPRYFFSRKLCVEIALRNQKEGKAHGFLTTVNSSEPTDNFGRLLICGSGEFRYIGTQCLLALTLELVWELEENRKALRSITGNTGPSSSTSSPTPGPQPPASTPGTGFNLLGTSVSGAQGINEMFDVLRCSTQWMHARVRAGEVNIKGYLFGCAMLAEVEALQRGLADEEVFPLVEKVLGEAAAEALGMLKELHAAATARTAAGEAGTTTAGTGGVGGPRYTGMDGTQVLDPASGVSERFEAVDTEITSAMSDWDWDAVSISAENMNIDRMILM